MSPDYAGPDESIPQLAALFGATRTNSTFRPLSFRLAALHRPQFLYIPVHNPSEFPLSVRARDVMAARMADCGGCMNRRNRSCCVGYRGALDRDDLFPHSTPRRVIYQVSLTMPCKCTKPPSMMTSLGKTLLKVPAVRHSLNMQASMHSTASALLALIDGDPDVVEPVMSMRVFRKELASLTNLPHPVAFPYSPEGQVETPPMYTAGSVAMGDPLNSLPQPAYHNAQFLLEELGEICCPCKLTCSGAGPVMPPPSCVAGVGDAGGADRYVKLCVPCVVVCASRC